jgi:non-reducing end alpha-L-arabinofuranosidase
MTINERLSLLVPALAFTLTFTAAGTSTMAAQAAQAAAGRKASPAPAPAPVPARPQGPCDIYAAAGAPCVAAHSTTRALYAAYNGPLYKVLRQSDSATLDIGIVQPAASPVPDAGGYANAAAQDAFCANTVCWITTIYDQSPKHNDLVQAPRGGFSGPAMGGFNNLPIADMAPITIMGHKAYGVFIAPGMGLRQNDVKGTAVDDQAEGQYWVINGRHYNSGCCFDYGNAEIDSRDDDNGTMETTYYGNATAWYRGTPPGPWIMTDQENNLVGCVNADGSKLCPTLPSITWRFVTAMAKGEPHHWTSLGGDAQKGSLAVMFDGPRIDITYDPMRKQGAILLGNGGDNSVGSQGTFYEGAMTAAGTFPSDATDQLVQANVVAAKYDVARLSVAPASATATPPGLQTFSPGSSQDTTVTFTNTTGAPVAGVELSIAVPSTQWKSVASGTGSTARTSSTSSTNSANKTSTKFAEPIAPGASVNATFTITSGPSAFNGDLVGHARWTDPASGATHAETMATKVRNVAPIKINEFRVSDGSTTNTTNAFIELFNAGTTAIDISNWTLIEHQTQQAMFSTVKIPAGQKLAAGGFYLLGLSNSGLAAAARKGDVTVSVRNTAGMNVGDSIAIDTGADVETRKIVAVGTPAAANTTLWQPLPDGPVITIPVGLTNVPVTSIAGFAVGEKIALGYGATYPSVAKAMERYEVATVTAIGKPGTQAFLGADAPAGATNIKVTSVANISPGDQIRLDIDSVGHGIETVTVKSVGTAASRTALSAPASAGATTINVRNANGFVVGDALTVGTPATHETVTITAIGASTPPGAGAGAGANASASVSVNVTPALAKAHVAREFVVAQGTGLDLVAPLRFAHAANLPFSARGTGISFEPATKFAHSSNEPVQALGTGLTLDSALTKDHAIDAVVRDAAVTTAGYQGTPAPNQWFGGPALSGAAGSIVLRDAAGLVVDSLNYGLHVDPWASEGYQSKSGAGESGCRVPTPGPFRGGFGGGGIGGPNAAPVALPHRSAGRFPDGHDTDSNCTDFVLQPATTLAAASAAGATNIKVANVSDFAAGQTIQIDTGASRETAVIATVGTAATPLPRGQAAGTQDFGSGITLTAPLSQAHASGTPIVSGAPTPGAPNIRIRN